MSLANVLAALESGTLHVERRRKRKQLGGRRKELVTWRELAAAAMLRWTPMQIYDALGEHANQTLPSLLRPVKLEGVRLPVYQIRLLEVLAQRDGVSVEEYLHTSLLGLEVAASPEEIEELIPGFTEAMAFPNV